MLKLAGFVLLGHHLDRIGTDRTTFCLADLRALRLQHVSLRPHGVGVGLLLGDLDVLDTLYNFRRRLVALGLRLQELLGVRPADGAQGGLVDSDSVVQARASRLQLLQGHDLHDALGVASGVRVSLRDQFDVVQRGQQHLWVPLNRWLAVALPEALGVLAEAVAQEAKLFGLCGMHALVNRVQDLGGLLDHRQGGSDRRIGPALANLHLRRAAEAHAGGGNVLGQRHQGC